MEKIKIPSNLTSLAYASIKQYILDGRLDENSRLTEDFLSRQLGISKSPIREALNRLENEALIHIEPRRGAYLRTFTIKEIEDLYELREALESHVVRTVEPTPELIAALRQSVGRLRDLLISNDKSRYIEEDTRFHSELAAATGNAQLCQVLENVQNRIWIFRRKTYDLSSSGAPDFHESILNWLEKGRKDRAEQAMRDHIESVERKLIEFVRQEAEQKSEMDRTNRVDMALTDAQA